MAEEEKKQHPRDGPTVPLKKDSGQMEAKWARIWEEELRDLLERYPEHFRLLYALVDGHSEEGSQDLRRDLRRWNYLLRDDSPHPDVKAIMTASVRETPDGLCIVDPIDVKTTEDAATVQRFDEQQEEQRHKGLERLLRKLRRMRDEDTGMGPGQSR